MHTQTPRTKRGSNLQSNKARANNNNLLSAFDSLENCAGIRPRAHVEEVGFTRTRNCKLNHFRASGEKERTKRVSPTVLQLHLLSVQVERTYPRIEDEVNTPLLIEVWKA